MGCFGGIIIFGNIHILQLIHEGAGCSPSVRQHFILNPPVKDSAARYERVPAERKGTQNLVGLTRDVLI